MQPCSFQSIHRVWIARDLRCQSSLSLRVLCP